MARIFVIEKPGYKIGYFSFNRLLKENRQVIPESVKKSDLPVKIAFNQVLIYELEVDDRL
jgi:hypothetical protein